MLSTNHLFDQVRTSIDQFIHRDSGGASGSAQATDRPVQHGLPAPAPACNKLLNSHGSREEVRLASVHDHLARRREVDPAFSDRVGTAAAAAAAAHALAAAASQNPFHHVKSVASNLALGQEAVVHTAHRTSLIALFPRALQHGSTANS